MNLLTYRSMKFQVFCDHKVNVYPILSPLQVVDPGIIFEIVGTQYEPPQYCHQCHVEVSTVDTTLIVDQQGITSDHDNR